MDEQNSSNDGASDGAEVGTSEGATADAGATVSREAYDKALADSTRREEAARTAQTRAAQAEQELAEFKAAATPATKTEGEQPPEWAQALITEIADLKTGNQARTRSDARDELLRTVPDGNRAAAELMLRGIESSDGLDLTKPADAELAAAKLSTHTTIFVDHTRGDQRAAAQVGPDGKLMIPQGMTLDDVPPELADQIFSDPEQVEQLRSNTAGVLGSSKQYVI